LEHVEVIQNRFISLRDSPHCKEYRVVTKKEIVKVISEKMELTQLKTKEIVQRTFDAIVDTLVEETQRNLEKGGGDTLGRIELRNFGVFEVKKRAARKARNPRTGAKVFVPEKFVVTFKPGKEMEERVRQLERQYAQSAEAASESPAEAPQPTQPSAQAAPVTEAFGAPPSFGTNPGGTG
jgi:nucleoid DNA-binding protein